MINFSFSKKGDIMEEKEESTILTICVPVYNEERSIKEVISGLKNTFPNDEIIVVDDGSVDNTYKLLKEIEGIIVLRNKKNMGYGFSLKRAMRESSGEYIAWFDGDGQHKPEDLKMLYDFIKKNNYDSVIGARGKDSYKVKKRIVGKKILKYFAQIIVGEKIPDLNSGMRIFKRAAILKYLHLLPNGFSASSTSTIIMYKKGYLIEFLPIKTVKRKGESNVSIVKDGLRSLKLLFNLLILFEAFNFFLILSLLQIIPGIIYGVWIAFKHKLGFPVFASILIITGVFTFFMGILAEQITSLRKDKFE